MQKILFFLFFSKDKILDLMDIIEGKIKTSI